MKGAAQHTLKQIDRVAGRAGADTIRLWEGYREQALLWRMLALVQIPTSFVAISAALVMFFFADTVVNVPPIPQPGHYSVQELPDAEFQSVATEFLNLINSYQPRVARRQYLSARKFLWEPALSIFDSQWINSELRVIEETDRSQLFFVNERQIKFERYPELDKVIIRIPGTRQKLIGRKPLEPDQIVFYVTMTTIPRNIHNEYGIVVIDFQIRRVDFQTLSKEDRLQMLEAMEAQREDQEG